LSARARHGEPAGSRCRIQLRLIEVGQLKNVSLITRLRTLIDLPRSIFACRRLIREFKPDVVFGVGGYASGPAMAAAIVLKVPAMAFEPNAMPGLANRLVGKRVQAAAVNFPAAASGFATARSRAFRCGRSSLRSSRPTELRAAPARSLAARRARASSTPTAQMIAALLDAVPGLTVLHQSGARHFDRRGRPMPPAGATRRAGG
jgi:UDP-N-acetylglucosamine--N-acetylmuramyl-(pentapeptide) pyrophosphoryl-undecaprenol N-acetylglucosamine transferase